MHFDQSKVKARPNPSSTSSSDSGIVFEDTSKMTTDGPYSANVPIMKAKNDDNTSRKSFRIEQTKTTTTVKKTTTTDIITTNDDDKDGSSISPTVSIRSNNISIMSIDEDFESSLVDSDSDLDNDKEVIVRKLGEQTPSPNDINKLMPKGEVINQTVNGMPMPPSRLQVANLSISNSPHVNVGDVYQGNVVIQQYIMDTPNKSKTNEGGKNNPAFQNDSSDDTTTKNTINDDSNPKRSNISPIGAYKYMLQRKAICITLAIVIISTFIGIAILTTMMIIKNSSAKQSKLGDGDDSRRNIPINSTIGEDNIAGGMVYRFVTRDEWVAQPPSDKLTKLNLPVHRVIIQHTATEGCSNQSKCTFRVRFIQTFHMESRNFDDIAYNFLVGGDGSVYEGRGWENQGAHTKGFNVDSICVAFVGTFIKNPAPERQLKAAQMVIEEGVKLGKIVPDYKLYGARQLSPTESPGEALYNVIKQWPHWSDEL